jgi:hypothetical protein
MERFSINGNGIFFATRTVAFLHSPLETLVVVILLHGKQRQGRMESFSGTALC